MSRQHNIIRNACDYLRGLGRYDPARQHIADLLALVEAKSKDNDEHLRSIATLRRELDDGRRRSEDTVRIVNPMLSAGWDANGREAP